jgi:protein-disulfide isomerase
MSINKNLVRLSSSVSARDHSEGAHDAVVTLVEYGDYECSHCRKAYPIVKEVQRRLGSELRFVFRHFPLSQIHPHATRAAEAAEAAGAQGKFWHMHDTILDHHHQDALDDSHLREYAAKVGVKPERFNRELTTHIHAARVREDFLSGITSGVNGTPTFFINSVRHDGSWDVDTLEEALREHAASVRSSHVA